MCFSAFKHKALGKNGQIISKKDAIGIIADAWKELSDDDRAYWDEEARNDKLRYVKEKAASKGPWEQPKRRAKKHPLAPKRPMSAFLKYSQQRRKAAKAENPDMSNTDISRLLGEMWRNTDPEERRPFQEVEEKERAVYKAEIAKWRADQARIERERTLRAAEKARVEREAHQTEKESKPSPWTSFDSNHRSGPLQGHDPNNYEPINHERSRGNGQYYIYPSTDYRPSESAFDRGCHYGNAASQQYYSSYQHHYGRQPTAHPDPDGTQKQKVNTETCHYAQDNPCPSRAPVAYNPDQPTTEPGNDRDHESYQYYAPPLPSESRKTKASVYTDHYSHHPGANYSNPEYECQYPPEPMHPIAHRNDANNNSAEINATYSHEESRWEYNEYNMPPPLPAPDFNDGPDFDPPSSSTGSGGYIVKL